MEKSSVKNIVTVIGILIAFALTRLIDHPLNFTPVAAIILFSTVFIDNKFLKIGIPFFVILFSDVLIEMKTGFGFHQGTGSVYLGYVLIFLVGYFFLKTVNVASVIISSLAASIVFFLVTNFAFFYPEALVSNPTLGQYSHDLSGIFSSYKAGIPFFRNMVFGDMFFTSILFGSYSWLLMKKLKKAKIKN